jgi:hypothetical protein
MKASLYSLSGNLGYQQQQSTQCNISGKTPIYDGGSGISNGALATRTVVGDPIGTFYGYKVTGIFQTTQEIAASKQPTAIPEILFTRMYQ